MKEKRGIEKERIVKVGNLLELIFVFPLGAIGHDRKRLRAVKRLYWENNTIYH